MGGHRAKPLIDVWLRWRQLVNMTVPELQELIAAGHQLGTSRTKARARGWRSGRDVAHVLTRMIPRGESPTDAERNWTPAEWEWAKVQVHYISRTKARSGDLRHPDGSITKKCLTLMWWGHNPFRG